MEKSPTIPHVNAPDGLTALHLAVIKSDLTQVRQLLASGAHSIDERTTAGATPLMLACLLGRAKCFLELFMGKARVHQLDHEGFKASDYVRQGKYLPFAETMVRRYEDLAGGHASRSGRKFIWKFLKSLRQHAQQSPKTRAPAKTHSPDIPKLKTRTVFLHKHGIWEAVEIQRLALFEIDRDLGRKTCAGIRGQNEDQYRAMAISGWRGDAAKRLINIGSFLNNAEYLKTTRVLGATYGHKFRNNPLDGNFPGTRLERAGAFSACHAEKQLGVFALRETMSQALGVRDLTTDNIMQLKHIVTQTRRVYSETAKSLQSHFIIELEHKPCPCCIAFLKMISQKSGLHFEWTSKQWYSEGKRPRLLEVYDGYVVRAQPWDPDAFDDEIDEGEGMATQATHEVESALLPSVPEGWSEDSEGVVVEHPDEGEELDRVAPQRKSTSFGNRRQPQRRERQVPRKEGSAVPESEWLNPRQNQAKRLNRKERKATRRRHITSSATYTATSNPTEAASSSSSPDPKRRQGAISFESPTLEFEGSSTHARLQEIGRAPFPNFSQWRSTFGRVNGVQRLPRHVSLR